MPRLAFQPLQWFGYRPSGQPAGCLQSYLEPRCEAVESLCSRVLRSPAATQGPWRSALSVRLCRKHGSSLSPLFGRICTKNPQTHRMSADPSRCRRAADAFWGERPKVIAGSFDLSSCLARLCHFYLRTAGSPRREASVPHLEAVCRVRQLKELLGKQQHR